MTIMPPNVPPKFYYPRDIASGLHDELQAEYTARSGSARSDFELKAPIPTKAEFTELLDSAFFTSLLEEEGRSTALTVAYVSAESATRLGLEFFRFMTPIPLEPAKLAKLAPAAALDRTFLAVWRDEHGILCVWGLISYGNRKIAIDLELPPMCLFVRVLRPGVLTVHYLARPFFLCSSNLCRSIAENRIQLTSFLMRRIKLDEEAQALSRLTRRMLEHGHGGTMLITEKGRQPFGLTYHSSCTEQGHGNDILKKAVADIKRFSRGGLPTGSYTEAKLRAIENTNADALDFVGRLTSIDGATVLHDDLSLIGFGATITTGNPQADPNHEVLIDEEDPYSPGRLQRKSLSNFPGNRHRSAIWFCANNPTGLAFVASQDGDLSLFEKRNDGVIHAIRPYKFGIGI